MADISELRTFMIDYDKQRLFLISEQANYRSPTQRNVLEYIVSNAGIHHRLLTQFEAFFLGVVSEFDQT